MGRYDLSAVEVRKIAKREEAIERINKKTYETVKEQEKFNADLGDEARAIYKIEEIDEYPQEDFKSEKVRNMKNSYQNSSANYFSGFIFEAEGDTSLAAPAYKKALELNPDNSLYKNSLRNLDTKNNKINNNKTEILVIVENGLAPQLSNKRFRFGVPTYRGFRRTNIFLPVINDNLVFNNNDISILANELKIPLETTTEVDVILKRYLKDSMPKYLSAAATRGLIQIASKEAFSRSTRGLRKYDGGATQLIGTALIEKIMLSSEPRVRTWSSLPNSIQMARFSLDKEKDNILRINLGSKSETIKVNTNKNYQLISIRVVGDEKYLRIENNNISEGNDYFNSIIKYSKN
jgi:tetratricopeptide (TPR) repeat protein